MHFLTRQVSFSKFQNSIANYRNTTKYDDSRNPKELDSTTVFGLAPFKHQGLYLPSNKGSIVLEETDETYDYRRICFTTLAVQLFKTE